MNRWYIPGAPLPDGLGWRVWVSWTGDNAAPPAAPLVCPDGQSIPVPVTIEWGPLVVPGVARHFGVLELKLATPSPGTRFSVTFADSADAQPLRWLALPSRLGPAPLSFLFASCFYLENDKQGEYYREVIRQITKSEPAFKLLMGDQVYQDIPMAFFDSDPALKLYADRYDQYWSNEPYRKALSSCPNFFVCDDHEFWNNSPEWQPHLARTHGPIERRYDYLHAGTQLFDAYQAAGNPGGARWFTFDLPPASFFVADTRSRRTEAQAPAPGFFEPAQWAALETWALKLTGPGILVIGQPFLQVAGSYKDYALCDFPADYARLCALIRRSHSGDNESKTPHHILILSGDIHCGRLAQATVVGAAPGFETLFEFITSPASLLPSSIGTPEPEAPPHRITLDGNRSVFRDVRVLRTARRRGEVSTSIHNNLGRIILTEISAGRVRAEVEIYCVAPFRHVRFWELGVDPSTFPSPGQLLFAHTIELR